MHYEFLQVTISDHIAEVALNRPDKANAFTETGFHELKTVFEELDENDDVRVIILSGNGKHFSAGIDLELLMSIGEKTKESCDGRKREKLFALIKRLQAPMNAVEACRKPVLAAIHGGCIGGALDLAVTCDMRYCAADAYFCIKEIDLGMVADLGTLQRLPKLISPGLVNELAYTGRNVGAEEAEKIGLVNRSFESKEAMREAVRQIAAQIAAKSPLSIRGTKQVLLHARDHSVAEGLDHIALWNAARILSEDLAAAGMAAMMKKTPTFRG
ncbi:MAG TPA: crotonase/enoyl-CoA hydratase family protein [Bacteroidia bacterium]|nr:crotonase/enoyl-CoA hydratase family protein [Bacteroidia bacterium]